VEGRHVDVRGAGSDVQLFGHGFEVDLIASEFGYYGC